MSANLLPKERSLKHTVLCESFDHRLRAETKNARENMRLEKQQRDIELFKNNIEKTYTAEKNRVKSRMQSLRKTVLSRAQSIETVSSATSSRIDALNAVHLPRLPKPTENGRKMLGDLEISRSVPDIQLLCAESEQKSSHLPTITLNSPQVGRRFKIEQYNTKNALPRSRSARVNRTQSHNDIRFEDRTVVEDINANTKCSLENNGITFESKEGEQQPEQRELLDVGAAQLHSSRFTSRRRSLSTGDITLAERIHTFLESVENCRLNADSSDYSSSNSEDEKDK